MGTWETVAPSHPAQTQPDTGSSGTLESEALGLMSGEGLPLFLSSVRSPGGPSVHALQGLSQGHGHGRGPGAWIKTGLPLLSHYHQNGPSLCEECLQGWNPGREL